jgi:3-oxoacyl-[acyl-carrier-protein] synthase-3
MIGIKHISPFFAGSQMAPEQLPECGQLEAGQLDYLRSTGIDSFYVADHHSAYDLAKAASEKLLAETGIKAEKLDMIIYIRSRLPETLVTSEAMRLQYELGATKATAYSMGDLGCADMSMAIKLGYDHLLANPWAEYVLVAHGCKPFSPYRFRYPVTITGDGGLALVLARTDENRIRDIRFDVNGSYWDLFKMEYRDRTQREYREECTDIRKYSFELALESRMRFLDLNNSLLESHSLGKEDIGHYLLQNVSSRAYEYYETAFEVSISPACLYNLSQYGHLGPNDVMLNYHAGIRSGLFEKGSKVLIMNNSPVAAWSSILVEV